MLTGYIIGGLSALMILAGSAGLTFAPRRLVGIRPRGESHTSRIAFPPRSSGPGTLSGLPRFTKRRFGLPTVSLSPTFQTA